MHPRARYGRGFRTRFITVPQETNVNASKENIVGAALASGLYPKILTLDKSGGMTTISNQQPVAIVSYDLRVPS
jgi:ATP-dependent RNA helicase DHX29